MAQIVSLPRQDGASAHAERQKRLFDWAFKVLEGLGLVQALANANSIEELHRIAFDADSTEVILAINEAKHPANGTPAADHFDGLSQTALKKILKNRFTDMKKDREKELLGGVGNQSAPDWTAELLFDSQGKIAANVANLILILRHVPAWQGVLAYSAFSGHIIIKQQPPWGKEEPDTSWAQQHTTKTSVWFLRNGMARAPSKDDILNAVEMVAKENSFHPVRNYFESLVWDGEPRLETWLQTYLMVADSLYVREIGHRFLMSSVARIYTPGAKVDHVLVLEGPQGKHKKSQTVGALVPNEDWFTDNLSNVIKKDAKMEVAGVVIIELAEMEAVARATSSAMKKFITLTFDRFRPPYGRHLIKWLRQCVFIGTINPTPGEGYLKDPTGARRFWPLRCGKETDLDGLKRDRDQLWAEAVAQYKAGSPWWLETPELEALATAEQDARMARDDWELPIRDWLEKQNLNEVTVTEVLKGALGLSVTHSAEIRVSRILKRRLGFKQSRPRNGERR